MGILLYPYFLLVFWYHDFFSSSVRVSAGVLVYTADLLSIPLFLKTFFKPLKSEYRQGLVGFSIGAGLTVKTIVLAVTIPVFLSVTLILLVLNLAILLLPAIIVWFFLAYDGPLF